MNLNLLADHPGFHVWIFNHPYFIGVGDQLHFLFKYLQQLGVKVTCGRQPSDKRCNIVIENFDYAAVQKISSFCHNYGKSIAIVLTEHLDVVGNEALPKYVEGQFCRNDIHLHGKSMNSDFPYLPLPVLLQRANCLLALRGCTNSYFRLGDLPEMHGFEHLVKNCQVDTLWFPRLDQSLTETTDSPQYDFVFLGAETPFRKSVINQLSDSGFTFAPITNGLSVKRRHFLYKQARFCLNIPQDEMWPWLSPMRIISALQGGVPTLSIGTNDPSAISACTTQLPLIENEMDASHIRRLLASHKTVALNALKAYDDLTTTGNTSPVSFLKNLNSWALTDGIML